MQEELILEELRQTFSRDGTFPGSLHELTGNRLKNVLTAFLGISDLEKRKMPYMRDYLLGTSEDFQRAFLACSLMWNDDPTCEAIRNFVCSGEIGSEKFTPVSKEALRSFLTRTYPLRETFLADDDPNSLMFVRRWCLKWSND